MQYKIVKSDPYTDTLGSFEDKAETFLKDGWELAGGLVVLPVETGDPKSLSTQFLQSIFQKR